MSANSPESDTMSDQTEKPFTDRITDILPEPFEWCEIPAGRVTLEDDAGTFDVPPFMMAKYPVTRAQFGVFVAADDGFRNEEWWQGLAADRDHQELPGLQRFLPSDHPREMVSWYDAVAFTRWLTRKVGYDVRLPTEWEWQWAAQGPDGRTYPWGNEYITGYANVHGEVGKTTPVNRYPDGASPFGVLDMSGNVWEWCLNEHENVGRVETSGDALRVVRGGSWDFARGHARVTYRFWGYTAFRNSLIGFRVVGLR